MSRGSVDMNFLFTLGELQRLVRAYADKQAARYGITRAQWAVLAKVERHEGMKQTELAEQMEMQPITLTRLIDKLCDNGWIERRGDDSDRRVNRLYLTNEADLIQLRLAKISDRTIDDALSRLSPGEQDQFSEFMARVKRQLQAMLDPASPQRVVAADPVEELV